MVPIGATNHEQVEYRTTVMEIVFWKKKKNKLNVSEERKDHFEALLW